MYQNEWHNSAAEILHSMCPFYHSRYFDCNWSFILQDNV